jgi:hypothetical protein
MIGAALEKLATVIVEMGKPAHGPLVGVQDVLVKRDIG